MKSKLLIDAIVSEAAVLIAQLATASGTRAPLAHLTDQVFLGVTQELETLRIPHEAAANLLGIPADRYEQRATRARETPVTRNQTLWEKVLCRMGDWGSLPRRELLKDFEDEDPIVLASVLKDLVSSGLLYLTGSGNGAVLGLTTKRDWGLALRERQRQSLGPMLCALIYDADGISRAALSRRLDVPPEVLDEALSELEAKERIERFEVDDSVFYRSRHFVVALDAEHGWEAAVFDHFRAMVRAICQKFRSETPRSGKTDVTGGATLGFDVYAEHPYLEDVLGLLLRVRTQANALWRRVESYNENHPIPLESRVTVCFYVGQSVAKRAEVLRRPR